MKISKQMQEAFSEQIKWEMWSSNLYLQMAFWLSNEGWQGFANWMFKQSAEETAHALEMAKYVLDRGGQPCVKAIDEVPTTWKDPKSVFEAAYQHEQEVTAKINKLSEKAEEENDRASINFIAGFIDEQVEEEKSARDIINYFIHHEGHSMALLDDKLKQREE